MHLHHLPCLSKPSIYILQQYFYLFPVTMLLTISKGKETILFIAKQPIPQLLQQMLPGHMSASLQLQQMQPVPHFQSMHITYIYQRVLHVFLLLHFTKTNVLRVCCHLVLLLIQKRVKFTFTVYIRTQAVYLQSTSSQFTYVYICLFYCHIHPEYIFLYIFTRVIQIH